jgi:hypothetical protein
VLTPEVPYEVQTNQDRDLVGGGVHLNRRSDRTANDSYGLQAVGVSWREFVFVGLLGGFTTFSTFGLDTITLFRAGNVMQAFSNVLIQVVGGLVGVVGGLVLFERPGSTVYSPFLEPHS